MVYLDNSATTPLDPRVTERMDRFRAASFANAGSVHQGGQRARVELELCRERIAALIGAEPKEIVFTGGGTEANNLALKGYAFRTRSERGEWPALITDRTEHHAVLHPAEFLASLGLPVHYVEVDRAGRVTPDALRTLLSSLPPDVPPLVSIMHANNETGTINPVADLAETAHAAGAIFHTDAVQSFGKLDCSVRNLGADMMTISAHKIYGPKGIGALYVNKEVELEPLMHGGAQERNRRGGTEPVELIAGFAEAAAIAAQERESDTARIEGLKRELRERLSGIEGIRFVTPEEDALSTILNVTFDDAAALDGEGLIVGMDLKGIAVSNGSACTSGSMQPSHVLLAMGYPAAQAKGAVRFSPGRFTTSEDIVCAADGLRDVVGRMRGHCR